MRNSKALAFFTAVASILNVMLPSARAGAVYDNVTNAENNPINSGGTDDGSDFLFIGTNFNLVTGKTSSKYGDNAAGGFYALAAGTTDITGFDLYPIVGITNNSGGIVQSAANNYSGLKMTVYVWGGVNLAGVNTTNPAFSNLLGSATFTSPVVTNGFDNGYLYNFENASNPGKSPGFTLPTPISIPSTVGHDSIGEPVIGISYLVTATKDGNTYAAVNGISPIFTYGSPASVGDMADPGLGDFNTAFFFNNSNEQTGNFVEGPYSFTAYSDSAMALRVYGDIFVPEPASMALPGASFAALLGRRRRFGSRV